MNSRYERKIIIHTNAVFKIGVLVTFRHFLFLLLCRIILVLTLPFPKGELKVFSKLITPLAESNLFCLLFVIFSRSLRFCFLFLLFFFFFLEALQEDGSEE